MKSEFLQSRLKPPFGASFIQFISITFEFNVSQCEQLHSHGGLLTVLDVCLQYTYKHKTQCDARAEGAIEGAEL